MVSFLTFSVVDPGFELRITSSVVHPGFELRITSSVVHPGFELRKTKDYNIGICCFSSKHAVLRSKSKDWLAQNQDNVYKWNDMSICELLFQ